RQYDLAVLVERRAGEGRSAERAASDSHRGSNREGASHCLVRPWEAPSGGGVADLTAARVSDGRERLTSWSPPRLPPETRPFAPKRSPSRGIEGSVGALQKGELQPSSSALAATVLPSRSC